MQILIGQQLSRVLFLKYFPSTVNHRGFSNTLWVKIERFSAASAELHLTRRLGAGGITTLVLTLDFLILGPLGPLIIVMVLVPRQPSIRAYL